MFYGRRKKSVSAHCTRNLSTPAITIRSTVSTSHALCGHQSEWHLRVCCPHHYTQLS
ncbi:uncharacterized protein LAESUDRAFT_729643 [Laetiporus sulphureus 93-53]|uniref:Uncharacterized protein n=1 Tax=Laetiporus sulphureus 93-53 TaxID=1314785 RepID=A0A165CIN9_9APHY|nr:uncharacterized protein LAESUDRAFT_729643 [Laetiporus sulphureus 93-53]KZT02880.1 hypothetical protein LAESUDRAFT_729643 [Laetiporus sulphureus 93-53]